MEDEEHIQLKLQINNLIWMHAPGDITLSEAEERACSIINLIQKLPIKE
jgi:hypothetical protein